MTNKNTSIILAIFSLYFFINLTEGRILLSPRPWYETYNYSEISAPPTEAPNAHSPSSYDHIVDYSPAPSSSSSDDVRVNVFDVRSFGGVGDGLKDDTLAFKSAWDAACGVENAKVVTPRGYSFLLQPLTFTGPCKSGVVFQIEGTIMPPDGPESWPKISNKRQWIIFYRTHGLTLQGGGLIDGRGEKWWNLPCKPHKLHLTKKILTFFCQMGLIISNGGCILLSQGINGTTMHGPCDSPVAMRFFGSTNLTMRGLKLINSPQFHIRFDSCQSVNVDSLVIKSPPNSPNTDGIHVENTSDVMIHNSVISNGDDCISIGAGSHNLDIRNITCGPSHGISIGSLGVHNSKACVSNITVTNCLIRHSDNGVRIKTWQGGSGSVSAITFDSVHMDTVRNPIIIDQYYCLSTNCSNQTSAISINTISYSNIKGTYDPRGPPVHLGCSDPVPCTNITLLGLELQPVVPTSLVASHKHKLEPFCWNAYGSSLGSMTTTVPCLLEGLPYLGLPDTDFGLC